ncbi:MAG: winged helix-turn-helix domain-containing protein, partial [Pseudomonadota bacterium]
YLVKPFAMDELMARLRALTRRRASAPAMIELIGCLRYDRTARRLLAGEVSLDLPRKELAAFECLLERRGQLTPKARLLSHLYGTGADIDASAVEVHISRLRKRLRDFDIEIRTARGLGYMLVEPE